MTHGCGARTLVAGRRAALALGVAALVRGTLVEPHRLRWPAHPVPLPPGPGPAGRRATLVHLSDLHLHRLGRLHEELLAGIRDAAPDLIVLTGDSVDRRGGLGPLGTFLSLLDPAVPKLAVMGNWEHRGGVTAADLRPLLERAGGELLMDRSVRLTTPAGPLRVTGMDDEVRGRPDLERALHGVEDEHVPHLLLAHCPSYRDRLAGELAEIERRRTVVGRPPPPRPFLVLSGHTHGGQVRLGRFAWTPRGSGPYLAGWYRDPGLADLFVSRGVGAVVPMRLGSVPEVPVLGLVRAPAPA